MSLALQLCLISLPNSVVFWGCQWWGLKRRSLLFWGKWNQGKEMGLKSQGEVGNLRLLVWRGKSKSLNVRWITIALFSQSGRKGRAMGVSLTLRSRASSSIWMVVYARRALGSFLYFLGFNQFSSRLGWVGLLYGWFISALPFLLLLAFRPFFLYSVCTWLCLLLALF